VKREHEIAVANRLLNNLALTATFLRSGNEDKNEPDVIYSFQGALLGVEVAGAPHDDEQLKTQWSIARGKVRPPKGTPVFLWKDGIKDPDDKVCARIQREIDEKCARKAYSGIDRVWLCVEHLGALSSEREVVEACVKRLRIPREHQFEKIFIHYYPPWQEGSKGQATQVWPAESVSGK
jgi:hypothetical protein